MDILARPCRYLHGGGKTGRSYGSHYPATWISRGYPPNIPYVGRHTAGVLAGCPGIFRVPGREEPGAREVVRVVVPRAGAVARAGEV